MVSLNSNKGAKNNGYPQSSPDALHLWKRFKKVNKQEVPNEDRDEKKKKSVSSIRRTSDNFNTSSGSSLEIFKRTIEPEKLFRMQCQSQYKTRDSSFSTDSSSGSDRERSYLKSDDDYTNCKQSVNMTGVLHLRKPLSVNLENDQMYYEDRGRMAPIDWKNIISTSQGSKPEKVEKLETSKETIRTIAKSKPQISDEFSNFVENSISHKTVYNKEGNIERNINTIDSPIFKIQQRISRKTLNTIQIPASVKSSFFQTSSDSHLLNRIDTFRVIDPMTAGIKSNNHIVENTVQVESQHQDSKVKIDKQTQDCRPTHTCDDYDRITFIDTLTDEESAAKRESRKKEMEYNDELFTFVENLPESSSSQINVSLPAPSARKQSSHKFPFHRIKAVCREKKTMNTLDSDDTLNVSSDLDSFSNCTTSIHSSFEAVRRKMNKLTSSHNNQTSEDRHILPNDDKILENKNKLLNRCIRASHDYLKAPENNVVEITEVKVGSRPEPLIKPISTRYFAKDSNDAKECSDMNMINNVSIKSLQQEKQDSNSNIDDSISSTISIENELCQKDDKIDSGFCIKSTDSSSSIHNSSETRIESETYVEKNDFASETTEKLGRKSEMMKMSSDSENEEMDCQDFIDYDAFDIENVELFFPGLNVENLKKEATKRMIGENNGETLASDFEISSNNYSNCSASLSSNLYSDSQNSPSPNSQFSFNSNIFENVNINLSTLTTDGLDYSDNQTQKHKNANLTLYPTNEIDNTTNQKTAMKTDSEPNFISNNNVTSLCNVEKSEFSNEKAVATPKPVSKKMQKYRSTLENYKKKFKTEADSKKENKNLEQLDNSSQIEILDQKPLQRPILKEIQKRMHKLTFKNKFAQ